MHTYCATNPMIVRKNTPQLQKRVCAHSPDRRDEIRNNIEIRQNMFFYIRNFVSATYKNINKELRVPFIFRNSIHKFVEIVTQFYFLI